MLQEGQGGFSRPTKRDAAQMAGSNVMGSMSGDTGLIVGIAGKWNELFNLG